MTRPKGEWTDVLLAFRMSLDVRKLWMAAKGIVLSVVLVGLLLSLAACIYHGLGVRFAVPLEVEPHGPLPVAVAPEGAGASPRLYYDSDVWGALRRGSFSGTVSATRAFVAGLVQTASREAGDVLARTDTTAFGRAKALWTCPTVGDLVLVALLASVVLLLVWSYYGAAIMRLAAVEYALGERIELASAAAYAWRKHHCVYGPPLGLALSIIIIGLGIAACGLVAWNLLILVLALAGLIGLAVGAAVARDRTHSGKVGLGVGLGGLLVLVAILVLIGWLGWRIPYVGEILLGLLSPFAVLGGFVIAIMIIWLSFGLPLMVGTVCSSDAGTFDAWSRSFHYLFTHPWRYAWHLVVAAAYGAVCLGFVYVVRVGTEWAALLPLTAGPLLAADRLAQGTLSFFLTIDSFLLDLIFAAFVISYVFSALVVVYFLLRQCSDGTPINEVHLEPRDRERLEPPAEDVPEADAADAPESTPEAAPEAG